MTFRLKIAESFGMLKRMRPVAGGRPTFTVTGGLPGRHRMPPEHEPTPAGDGGNRKARSAERKRKKKNILS